MTQCQCHDFEHCYPDIKLESRRRGNADMSSLDTDTPTTAFVGLTTSMSQDDHDDENAVRGAIDSTSYDQVTNVASSDDELPIVDCVDPSGAGIDAKHLFEIQSSQADSNIALSVTPQRKDQLLLKARSDRLLWIQRIPLPYQTNESTESNRFSRFLHYSHATQHMPSAARILEHLYGDDLDRVDSMLKSVFENGNTVASIGNRDGCKVDDQLVHLTGNQILKSAIDSTTDLEANSALQNYQSFLKRLQDPECALLVQGMRTFFRSFPDFLDPTIAMNKLKEYRLAMLENVKQHALFKDIEISLLRRSLESFLFGHARAHLERLVRTQESAKDDETFQEKMEALQFVTPVHLDIHCLVENHIDLSALQSMLSKPVEALQSIDSYHSSYEKLQQILAVYKSVSTALTRTLQKNPSTANKLPSADDVLPTIILSVLMARPKQLALDLQMVEELCPPEDLRGEAGYAFANLYGAYQFLSDLDLDKEPASLSISKEAFRDAMDLHRAELNTRLSSLEKPAAEDSSTAKPSSVDEADDFQFPSPLDIRLARMQGEVVDIDWARRWQKTHGKKLEQDAGISLTGLTLPRSAIEMAEQGLPVGFRRNYSFLTTRSDDIRVHDLPLLLDEYRMLVHTTESLLGERVLRKAAERKATARSLEKSMMIAAQSVDLGDRGISKVTLS